MHSLPHPSDVAAYRDMWDALSKETAHDPIEGYEQGRADLCLEILARYAHVDQSAALAFAQWAHEGRGGGDFSLDEAVDWLIDNAWPVLARGER